MVLKVESYTFGTRNRNIAYCPIFLHISRGTRYLLFTYQSRYALSTVYVTATQKAILRAFDMDADYVRMEAGNLGKVLAKSGERENGEG